MNIILFETEELTGNRVLLNDHRAKHIIKVLQSKPGDILRVGMIDGHIGDGRVVSIKRKFPFLVELSVNLTRSPNPSPVIDLLLALPRPIMLKRILSQVTALGVVNIHLVNANRVEKSFWNAGIIEEEEYRSHLIHGLEQAVDTRVPQVHIHRHFKPFMERLFPDLASQYDRLLLAHPAAKQKLCKCISSKSSKAQRVLYAVGPEGGWVDYEVEKLLSAGVRPFSLGSRILKVDTAVVAIHSRISQILEGH